MNRIIGILLLLFFLCACSSKPHGAHDPINTLIDEYEARFRQATSDTEKNYVQSQFGAALQQLIQDSLRGIIQSGVVIKEITELYGRDMDWFTITMQNGNVVFKQKIASGDLKSEPLFHLFHQKKKGDNVMISARFKELHYEHKPTGRENSLVLPDVYVFVDTLSSK